MLQSAQPFCHLLYQDEDFDYQYLCIIQGVQAISSHASFLCLLYFTKPFLPCLVLVSYSHSCVCVSIVFPVPMHCCSCVCVLVSWSYIHALHFSSHSLSLTWALHQVPFPVIALTSSSHHTSSPLPYRKVYMISIFVSIYWGHSSCLATESFICSPLSIKHQKM